LREEAERSKPASTRGCCETSVGDEVVDGREALAKQAVERQRRERARRRESKKKPMAGRRTPPF
jgi:hypothetical protein